VRSIAWVVAVGLLACGCESTRSHPVEQPSGPARESVTPDASTTDRVGMQLGDPREPGGSAGTAGRASPGNDAGGSSSEPDAGDSPAAEPPADLTHTFPELSLAANEEKTGVCQSWTLDNDEPLFVNRVVASNLGGLHHSNWIWVDDASYDGPDGTWPCDERGFEQVLAAAAGGVFFAQSTQARHDVQAFPPGAAFEMPAHARIIGDIHLLNVAAEPLATNLRFDIFTLPASDVRVKLQPMAFTNTALDIAAAGDTSARMQCAVPQPDFDVYYVLPHFHENGRQLRVDVAGGERDGSNLFTSRGSFGDALGQVFDPPARVRGAEGLVITCDYQNASEQQLGYGVGEQEMCVVLIYATGLKAGGTAVTNVSVEDTAGIHRTDALCLSVGTP
jgi:hypothetical protein